MKFRNALILTLVATLGASGAFAAEDSSEDLEAKLRAAHEKLEQAAREVAELSAEIGRPFVHQYRVFADGPRRSMMGVQLSEDSKEKGARIERVSPGGPAEAAGLKAGDVIVAIDGKEVDDDDPVRDVARRVGRMDPESKVKVAVLRDGKRMEYDVELRAAAEPGHGLSFPGVPVPPGWGDKLPDFIMSWSGSLSGMELATLTPRLGKYFGTEKGVLVVRAPERGDFQLQDGDVILSIDGREPTSGSHATRILRSYQPGETLRLKIMRDRKQMDLTVTLPERERRARRHHSEERA